jgi:hypothetical protein
LVTLERSTVMPPTTTEDGDGAAPLVKLSGEVPVLVPSVALTVQPDPAVYENEVVSVTGLPTVSYAVIEVVYGEVVLGLDGRLPPTVAVVVAEGCSTVPIGNCTSVGAVVVATTPLVAFQPCTTAPPGLTRYPLVSKVNAPARV